MLKQFRNALISASLFFFGLTQNVLALEPIKSIRIGPCGTDDGKDRFGRLCSSSTVSHTDNILRNIILGAMIFAAVLALTFLIFGGFKWITSGGDKAKIEAARNMIIAAIIGLVLTLLTYFILSTVLRIFGIDILQLTIPQLQS